MTNTPEESARLVKRFQIIENAIKLGDEEIIAMQAVAVEKSAPELAALLHKKEYAAAMMWLADYRRQHAAIAEYEDPQVAALRLEIQSLEQTLAAHENDKAEMLRLLNEFNSEYMKRLGPLVSKILILQAETAELIARENPEQAEKEQAAQKARAEYDDFNRQKKSREADMPYSLNDEQKQELKKMYRRASRMCHPDKLADADKERGKKFFQALNAAYQKQDIKRVEEILNTLLLGGELHAFSETAVSQGAMEAHRNNLRERCDTLQAELAAIKDSEEWQTLSKLDNWDDYFKEQEAALKRELNRLKKAA